MKAAFLDTDTFGKGFSLSSLAELPLEWTFYPMTKTEEVRDRIRDAEIVVTNKVVLGRKELEGTKVKLIAVTATGFNIIDIHAAKELGIVVCNVPAYSTRSVVQHIFTLMLALSSNLIAYAEDTKAGKWQKSQLFTFLEYPIQELAGKNLGLIGYGAQGKEVERLGKSFHMNIHIARHTDSTKVIQDAIHLHEVLEQADYLVISVPLTPKTKDMIRAKELSLMKPTAFLINTARGGIVNEVDLAEALKGGRLAGAGIDVLSEEPPKPNHPLLQKDVPGLILTPHIAWATTEARTRCLEITKANISAFIAGVIQNQL